MFAYHLYSENLKYIQKKADDELAHLESFRVLLFGNH